jgi:hypothetical protein
MPCLLSALVPYQPEGGRPPCALPTHTQGVPPPALPCALPMPSHYRSGQEVITPSEGNFSVDDSRSQSAGHTRRRMSRRWCCTSCLVRTASHRKRPLVGFWVVVDNGAIPVVGS